MAYDSAITYPIAVLTRSSDTLNGRCHKRAYGRDVETSTTGGSLTRRLRVLAHLQPLLDIEHDKNRAARAGGSDRAWDVGGACAGC